MNRTPTTGPDGYPYLEAADPLAVLEECTENGWGCVVDGYVYWYGQLWSQRALGTFDASAPGDAGGPQVVGEEQQALVGSPSEDVLPSWARRVLREALVALGVAHPRVAVVLRPGHQPETSLAIDLPPDPQRFTWYLPPSYALVDVEAIGADVAQPL